MLKRGSAASPSCGATVAALRNDIPGFAIHRIRESRRFSTHDGELCQWIDVELSVGEGWRRPLELRVSAGGRTTATSLVVFGHERRSVRCFAPALWPKAADTNARLTVTSEGRTAEYRTVVGTHRPWTIYVMSDLCADDTWAYRNLARHDRDDYLTTRAELSAGDENSYNLATTYQVERFVRHGSAEEIDALAGAVRTGRLHVTPVPCQLLCGAFVLSMYPALLEPFRDLVGKLDPDFGGARCAYHMEAPTWTNGLVNLLACAGFTVFAKSMLRYQAPWLAELDSLPRLTRLETAPGRFVHLLLGRRGYAEASPILSGVDEANRCLHEEVISEHEALGAEYPTSAIALIGMYSDLCPSSPGWHRVKMESITAYNSQGWEYPRLENASWNNFGGHLARDVGGPEAARGAKGHTIRLVSGDTGSSWEAWVLAAQREFGRFRRAQRDLVSLRSFAAMSAGADAAESAAAELDAAAFDVVYLGDHAWNGSSPESKKLNLSVRRNRLRRITRRLRLAGDLLRGDAGEADAFVAVNTLGWSRVCPVYAGRGAGHVLGDPDTGEEFTVSPDGWACVPVEAFGTRRLERRGKRSPIGGTERASLLRLPVAAERMAPALDVDGRPTGVAGGWAAGAAFAGPDDGSGTVLRGAWTAGPLSISAEVFADAGPADCRLFVLVEGAPPELPYDLRWVFRLPWRSCEWRGETGGGFCTPGPTALGGDSLLGIAGSIFSVGEGLSAKAAGAAHRIDFAFDESGLCGLGGVTTRRAVGTYNEVLRRKDVAATVWKTCRTRPVLEWYLLSTGQNPREALLDQGGARAWRFRCGMRAVPSDFDDAELYRFAAGFNTPAERAGAARFPGAGGSTLLPGGSRDVVILGLAVRGGAIEADVYNTSARSRRFTLNGPLVAGKGLTVTDMLGRPTGGQSDGAVAIPARSFLKVHIG